MDWIPRVIETKVKDGRMQVMICREYKDGRREYTFRERVKDVAGDWATVKERTMVAEEVMKIILSTCRIS